jgi:hypothetical protein
MRRHGAQAMVFVFGDPFTHTRPAPSFRMTGGACSVWRTRGVSCSVARGGPLGSVRRARCRRCSSLLPHCRSPPEPHPGSTPLLRGAHISEERRGRGRALRAQRLGLGEGTTGSCTAATLQSYTGVRECPGDDDRVLSPPFLGPVITTHGSHRRHFVCSRYDYRVSSMRLCLLPLRPRLLSLRRPGPVVETRSCSRHDPRGSSMRLCLLLLRPSGLFHETLSAPVTTTGSHR